MQTFLISDNFVETASCLDKLRLNKQILEAQTLLDIIINNKKGTWEHHPACIQWKEYPSCLAVYGQTMLNEALERNINYRDREFFDQCILRGPEIIYPDWLTDKRLHQSHRAKLKYKGRLDAVCATIKNNLSLFSINKWLKESGFSQKNMLQINDVKSLEVFTRINGWTLLDNWYDKFGWAEPNDNSIPYFWPSKNL